MAASFAHLLENVARHEIRVIDVKITRLTYKPVGGRIALDDAPGFGVELVDGFADKFPYIEGPNTLPNPRFPHAWERARAREAVVAAAYR